MMLIHPILLPTLLLPVVTLRVVQAHKSQTTIRSAVYSCVMTRRP